MPEMGELVNVVAGKPSEDNKCWFPHFKEDPPPANKWTNDSTTLSTNLADASAQNAELYLSHLKETTFTGGPAAQESYIAKYNPHHVLPGNASWPHTALKKWIHADLGHVQDDIGYDVNCYQNGIDLPSNNAMRGNWRGKAPDFQARYAFAAMDADTTRRQFHDAHKAYSDFVTKTLDKIAAKLDAKLDEKNLGCGDENCPANAPKEPYPTPLYVRARIHGTAKRLAGYLYGSPDNWRVPLFTSRFSLMYKNRLLTQEAAKAELSTDNFTY